MCIITFDLSILTKKGVEQTSYKYLFETINNNDIITLAEIVKSLEKSIRKEFKNYIEILIDNIKYEY